MPNLMLIPHRTHSHTPHNLYWALFFLASHSFALSALHVCAHFFPHTPSLLAHIYFGACYLCSGLIYFSLNSCAFASTWTFNSYLNFILFFSFLVWVYTTHIRSANILVECFISTIPSRSTFPFILSHAGVRANIEQTESHSRIIHLNILDKFIYIFSIGSQEETSSLSLSLAASHIYAWACVSLCLWSWSSKAKRRKIVLNLPLLEWHLPSSTMMKIYASSQAKGAFAILPKHEDEEEEKKEERERERRENTHAHTSEFNSTILHTISARTFQPGMKWRKYKNQPESEKERERFVFFSSFLALLPLSLSLTLPPSTFSIFWSVFIHWLCVKKKYIV